MKKIINKKILIVEDDLALLTSLKDRFEEEGFTIITAMDGERGLEAFEKEKPDLVIIDILMPKLDGISMAKKIKETGLGKPMIFLTNLSDMEHISQALAVETTDYLVKADKNINEIVARVRQKLGME